ncbi:hypothetical protein P8452_61505 [Trifolium repens]|nr:hypothetical protein P8452_61505 [Trifolium repens]
MRNVIENMSTTFVVSTSSTGLASAEGPDLGRRIRVFLRFIFPTFYVEDPVSDSLRSESFQSDEYDTWTCLLL